MRTLTHIPMKFVRKIDPCKGACAARGRDAHR